MTTMCQMSDKDVAALIRRPVRIGVNEKLLSVVATDETVSVLIETIHIAETSREYRLEAKSRKIMTWNRPVEDGLPWPYAGALVVPDTSFVPVVHLKYGEPNTPARIRAAREYARMCYRPGSERQPLDNYSRTQEGCTPVTMERHW